MDVPITKTFENAFKKFHVFRHTIELLALKYIDLFSFVDFHRRV